MLKTHLYQNAIGSPTVSFVAPVTICAGTTLTYTNSSIGATSYTWTFPGGNPATSTATNPSITYNTPGTFNVILNGANSTTNTTFSSVINVTQVGGVATMWNNA